ncbi:MAG TPA: CvpA family protein [Flavobacteriaceae bacterium]|nr:CvpA family protein [Flavobacteriaceae bacterium]
MSVIDVVLIALILFGLIRGFIKGFFVEIASLLALVLGIYGAIHFSNYAGTYLESKTNWDEKTISITAFAITFVGIVILITLAGKALTKIADFAALGLFNKLLGAAFGAVKTLLVLSVLLLVFEKTNAVFPMVNKDSTENSMLYLPVKQLVIKLFPILSSEEIQLPETV